MERHANIDATDLAIVASLKARRERMELTQSQVAAALKDQGVKLDQSGLSRAEQGKRALTVGEASAYAGVLCTTLDEVLRSDPLDELVADCRARVRALELSRSNALTALLSYSRNMDQLSSTLEQARDFSQHHSANEEERMRVDTLLWPVIEDARLLMSEEAEVRIANALDELEQTTTHSLSLRRSRGEEV